MVCWQIVLDLVKHFSIPEQKGKVEKTEEDSEATPHRPSGTLFLNDE